MKSMTGYGKASLARDEFELEIEIRSVNSRFLETRLSLPRELNFLEIPIKKTISSRIKRGTVDIRLMFKDKRLPSIELDENKLRTYWNIFQRAKQLLEVDDNISLEAVLEEQGVIVYNNNTLDNEEFLAAFIATLEVAIDKHQAMAYAEGEEMKKFFIESLGKIASALVKVGENFENYKKEQFEKLKLRIIELISPQLTEENEKRLVMETALYVDRADINEEAVRLASHISTFREKLSINSEELGKTLNFVTQEMQREANTMGSKFSTSTSFEHILIIKEEIERCREMIQNVE